jgi:hypothetical protein
MTELAEQILYYLLPIIPFFFVAIVITLFSAGLPVGLRFFSQSALVPPMAPPTPI